MRIFQPFVFRSTVLASFLFIAPTVALAGGGTPAPASPQPRPATEKKIWTNEDVEALGPRFEAPSQPGQTAQPTPSAAASAGVGMAASAAPLPPEKDPLWYSQQLESLESELADVSAHEAALQNFRATSKGLPTGLNVSAPCEGITTDNLIAQLDARRQELEAEIDALGDTARANDMAPGILVDGRGRVNPDVPLSPAIQRAQIEAQLRESSDELAATQDTVSAMNSDAASQNITLLQPDTNWGGNLTTNMQQNLYDRQGELQGQVDSLESQLPPATGSAQ